MEPQLDYVSMVVRNEVISMNKLLIVLILIVTMVLSLIAGFNIGVGYERNRIWDKLEMCV